MFHIVRQFEQTIAEYFGAPYAISTDSCTHAIELCLRYTRANQVASPEWTYPSIPMTFIKLGLQWTWQDIKWTKNYTIPGTNIVDAATQWEKDSYHAGTFMCVSFQFKKHLSLGRGGIILCDNKTDYQVLDKMRYDGRQLETRWSDQDIDTIGYHYYMTPETAQQGLDKFIEVKDQPVKLWDWSEYVYLPDLTVFNNVSNK